MCTCKSCDRVLKSGYSLPIGQANVTGNGSAWLPPHSHTASTQLFTLSLQIKYTVQIQNLQISSSLKKKSIRIGKFPLAPMGILASGSAHARPSAQPPHQLQRKKIVARVYKFTFKHLPQHLRSHNQSFGTLGQLQKIPQFVRQIQHCQGGMGGPRNIFLSGILIFFCDLIRSPCKVSEPQDNPFWEKSNAGRKREEEKKTPLIVDTQFRYTSCSDQLLLMLKLHYMRS